MVVKRKPKNETKPELIMEKEKNYTRHVRFNEENEEIRKLKRASVVLL